MSTVALPDSDRLPALSTLPTAAPVARESAVPPTSVGAAGRDYALTVGGFAVLRFSNEQVSANEQVAVDVARALAMIEELSPGRRRDERTSGEHRS